MFRALLQIRVHVCMYVFMRFIMCFMCTRCVHRWCEMAVSSRQHNARGEEEEEEKVWGGTADELGRRQLLFLLLGYKKKRKDEEKGEILIRRATLN